MKQTKGISKQLLSLLVTFCFLTGGLAVALSTNVAADEPQAGRDFFALQGYAYYMDPTTIAPNATVEVTNLNASLGAGDTITFTTTTDYTGYWEALVGNPPAGGVPTTSNWAADDPILVNVTGNASDGYSGWFGQADNTIQNPTVTNVIMKPPGWGELPQSFEGSFPPAGWTTYETNWTASPGWQSDTDAYTGSSSAWHNDDNAPSGEECDDWLVTPQLSVASGDELTFYEKNTMMYYYEYHGVWISDAGQDPSSGDYAELAEYSTSASSWTERSIDLTPYAGEDVYIAFRYRGDWASEWNIDDVDGPGIGSSPDYPDEDMGIEALNEPTGFLYEEGTSIPINVTVKNYGEYTQENVPVHLRVTNQQTSTVVYEDSTTTGLIGKLQHENVTFTWDATTICNHLIEVWTGLEGDENNSNNATSYQLSIYRTGGIGESFEDTVPPEYWAGNWSRGYEGHDGSYSAEGEVGEWLITPRVTVVADDVLKFWYKTDDSYDYNISLEVNISTDTDQTNMAAFDTQIWDLTFNESDVWQEAVINLTDYITAGTDIYIGFHVYGQEYDYDECLIDDVKGPEILPIHNAETSAINDPTDGSTIDAGSTVVNATVCNVGTATDTFDVNLSIYELSGGGAFFSENFATGIPGTWTIEDGGSSTDTWEWDSVEEAAVCDSDAAGSGVTMVENLTTPSIDCSAYTGVTLELSHYFNNIGSDGGYVYVSNDGGSTWNQVASYNSDTSNPQDDSIDISTYADGESDVQIRFKYDDGGSWAWYWNIYSVSLTTPASYDLVFWDTETVTDLDPANCTDVLFDPWLATGGSYVVNVTSTVTADVDTTNDYQEIDVTVNPDTTLPEIFGVTATPPTQSDIPPNDVNVTCTVTDNVGVADVYVDVDGVGNFSMTETRGDYYYTQSYTTGTYTYDIVAVDLEGNWNTSTGHTFEITANAAPDAPTNPSPADSATNIAVDPTLTVDVSDPDGDVMDVSFYNASDDSLIGTDTGVSSGGTASVSWSGLAYNTTYSWYAVANDSALETASATWSFTTMEEPVGPILFEQFEGTFPPTDWTVVNNGGDCEWHRNDFWPRDNYAGGDGYCAAADSDACGSGTTMDTELHTPTFSLADRAQAELSFVHSYNWLSSSEYAEVDISTDGGSTWTNLVRYEEDHDAYGPGEEVTIDLAPYAGNASCVIRFHYYSPGWNYWWQVDDVKVAPKAQHDVAVTAINEPGAEEPEGIVPLNATVCNNGQNAETFPVNFSLYQPQSVEQQPHDPDDSWSFATSIASEGFKVYENFEGQSTDIENVTWYGLVLLYSGGWNPGTPGNMNFYMDFYDDAPEPGNAPPSSSVATYDIAPADLTITDTGQTYSGFSMYKFEYELPASLTLSDGWIAIQGHDDPEGDYFLWASAKTGDGFSYQEGASPPETTYDRAIIFGPVLDPALVWSTEVTVTNLAPGACTDVTTSWPGATPGMYNLEVTADLAGDEDPTDNQMQQTVEIVGLSDVMPTSINAPTGDVTVNSPVTINATVYNNGTVPAMPFFSGSQAKHTERAFASFSQPDDKQSEMDQYMVEMMDSRAFDVQVTVYDDTMSSVYTDTETVPGLAVGASAYVEFDAWTPSAVGDYTIEVETQLADDMNTGNDIITSPVEVVYPTGPDIGVDSIDSPSEGEIMAGEYTVCTTITNYGNSNEAFTLNASIVGGAGGGGGGAYSFDFDSDDGGWTPTATWDPVGDWEWTDSYDVSNYVGDHDPPTSAHSGDGLWGTVLYDDYTNSGGETYLSKTFDFSGFTGTTMTFWYWSDLFGSWDYGYVEVDGTEVWYVDTYPGTAWQQATVDLSAYDGMSDVEVTFGVHASTVVNYAGLYIDDVEFTGAMNRADTLLTEGFEGGSIPPAGWTLDSTNTGYTWEIDDYNPHGGSYYASVLYDYNQDEWLISPSIDLSGYDEATLNFWWLMSYYWSVDPNDNYDLNVAVSTDGGSSWTEIWDEHDEGSFTSWEWYQTSLDLSAYAGESNVQVGFQYEGSDGAQASIDDITLTADTGGGGGGGGDGNLTYWAEETVTLAPGESTQVCFTPPWQAEVGNYTVCVTANQTGDVWPDNDQQCIDVQVMPSNIDVGTNSVNLPNGGEDGTTYPSGQALDLGATVVNNGNTTNTFDVTLDIPGGLQGAYLEEGFESGIPADWSIIQYSGDGTWEHMTYGGDTYYEPPGTGTGFAVADSDTHSSQTFDVGLFTPAIDLSGQSSITLTYARNYQNYAGYDDAAVNVYSGGTDASNFEEELWFSDTDDPSGGLIATHTFDPSSYADPSNVYIEFYYNSNGNDWLWSFAIDDINVSATSARGGRADYTETVTVTNLQSGHSRDVSFAPWTPPGPGDYTITVSVDEYGDNNPANDVQSVDISVADDTQEAPTSDLTVTLDPDGYYIPASVFHINAQDDMFPWKVYYRIDGGPLQEADWNKAAQFQVNPLNGYESGPHTIEYWAEDLAGNVEEHHMETYVLDADGPTTTLSFDGIYEVAAEQTYRITEDTKIVFDAEDNEVAVKNIRYRIGQGEWQTYTEPFTIDTKGTYQIYCHATDSLGNIGATKNVAVEVGGGEPTTTCHITPEQPTGDNGWYTTSVTAELTATDDASGVAQTMYRVGNGEWQTYTGPFEVDEDGVQDIQYYSTDNAGFREEPKKTTVRLDFYAPEIEISRPTNYLYLFGRPVLPLFGDRSIVIGSVTIEAQVTDPATSGVDNVKLYINNDLRETFGGTLSWSWDEFVFGEQTIEITATDKAGNEATETVKVWMLNL